MSDPMSGYHVTAQRKGNNYDERTRMAQSGVYIDFHDDLTDTDATVFLPDGYVSADNARKAIEAKLTEIRAIHQLGQPQPTAA